MIRIVTLAILVAAIGCGRTQPERETVNALPDQSAERPAKPVATTPVPTDDVALTYAERVEVERLLFRAADLESRGQFEAALLLVNQAVAVDPHSPRAAQMKERLEDLIRRIATTEPDHDQQLVTPDSMPVQQRTKG
jgi:hypothetical protein